MDSNQKTDKLCKYCGNKFIPKIHNQKFCSHKCNQHWWDGRYVKKRTKRKCIICEKEFESPKGNFKTCSEECKLERIKRMCSNEYKKLHTNFENKSIHDKKYYQQNNIRIMEHSKQVHYHKMRTDPNYRLRNKLRSRVINALKKNKDLSFNRVPLGCIIQELKNHLQATAIKNGYMDFDINTYDSKKYHIDHIIPCSKFNMLIEEERNKCFHYTNMQILTAFENFNKHDKLVA